MAATEEIRIRIIGESQIGDIDATINKLKELDSVLSNMKDSVRSMSALEKAANALTKLGNAVAQTDPNKFADFAWGLQLLGKEMEALGNADPKKLGMATNGFSTLAKLGNTIGKLDATKMADFAWGLQLVTKELEAVGGDTAKAFESGAKGAEAVAKLGTAVGHVKLESFIDFAHGLKLIATELKALENVDAQKLTDLAEIARGISAPKVGRGGKTSKGAEAKDGTKSVGGTEADKEKADAVKRIEDAAKRAAGGVRELETTSIRLIPTWSQITRLATGVGKAFSAIAPYARKAASALLSFTGIGQQLKGLGTAVMGFGERVKRGMSDIMRIVKYRAIRSAIRMITQGFSEGLKNAYNYANSIGNGFANSMNQIATAAQYAKNSLGAMAMPLINTVAPAIDYIVDKFVAFLNFINEAIASLTGQATWTRAIKNPVAWADNTADAAGKAAKAAKEAKATILGLDEINPLNGANDGGGSGGGGAGAAAEAAAMFETVATSADLLDNWGSKLADKINDGLDVISEKLEGLPEKAKAWTSGFASELNTLVDKIHWDTLGEDIGQGLNVIVYALNGFYDTFDWGNLGKRLSDAFDSAIKKFDAAEFGKLLGNKFNSIWETALGFVTNFDFSQLGSKIATGINNYFETANLSAKAESIARFLNGVVTTVGTALNEMDWDTITTNIANAINTFIETFDWKQAGINLGKFIGKLAKAAVDLVKKIDWGDLLAGLAEGLVYALGSTIDEALLGEHQLTQEQWKQVFGTPEPQEIEFKVKSGIVDQSEFEKYFAWDETQHAWLPNAQTKDVFARFKAEIDETLKKVVEWWNNLFGGGDGDKTETVTAIADGVTTAGFNKLYKKSGGNYAPRLVDKASKAKVKGSNDKKFTSLWAWNKKNKSYAPNIEGSSSKATLKGKTEKSFDDAYSKWRNVSNNSYKTATLTVKGYFDSKVDKLLNANLNGNVSMNVTARAGGGYVNTGEIFVAREAGPELVGTFGNRTAVANNDQIVSGITSGVASAMSGNNRLLAEQNNLLRQLVAKQNNGGVASTSDIIRALQGNNSRMGHPVVAMG